MRQFTCNGDGVTVVTEVSVTYILAAHAHLREVDAILKEAGL